jgi:hypothetical protein
MSKETDQYWTPASLFDALGLEFDLDPACPQHGPVNVPTRHWYSEKQNGLAQPWYGLVWMNPPYSNTTPWVDKFIEHGNGLALLPMAKSAWFNRLWQCADGMIPMPTNHKFEQGSIRYHTMLFALGETATNALRQLDWSRVR